MTALVPLHFDYADIRMVIRDGEPWWVLLDLCGVLQIKNHRDVAARLWGWQKDYVGISDAIGRARRTLVVNEAGAHSLILDSKRPEAERFAKWLFTEVLPSIRKHGCYPPPPVPDLAALPIDTEGPWDGVNKTMGQRFREERERWEAETGYRLIDRPTMNKQVVFAIENNLGGIRKGRRIEMLLYAGIDVLYVLTGRRTLTRAERAMCDAYRRADPAQRALVFGTAIALPPADDLA